MISDSYYNWTNIEIPNGSWGMGHGSQSMVHSGTYYLPSIVMVPSEILSLQWTMAEFFKVETLV